MLWNGVFMNSLNRHSSIKKNPINPEELRNVIGVYRSHVRAVAFVENKVSQILAIV